MKPVFAMIVLTVGILMGSQAYAEQWVVRRATTSGSCSVQKASAAPLGSQLGSSFSDAKAACTEAQKRKAKGDEDAGNSQKCQTYAGGTISTCKDAGVTL